MGSSQFEEIRSWLESNLRLSGDVQDRLLLTLGIVLVLLAARWIAGWTSCRWGSASARRSCGHSTAARGC